MNDDYTARGTAHARTEEVDYIAHAQPMRVLGDGGEPVGAAWTFAYLRAAGNTNRPVIFLFNGGPGCSSIWLHLSGLGPWRAEPPADLHASHSADEVLVPSGDSLLDVTDLVFVDPVETGFGRLADGVDTTAISGVDRDAALMAQIVRAWLERNDRLRSPVYLLGESYGTTRAALTATTLISSPEPVVVAGLALLGQCLNAQETTQRPGNPAGFIAALPLLAATAWYHERSAHGELELDQVVRLAHAFGIGDYASALLTGVQSDALVQQLAGFTGLDQASLRARRLRIDKEDYRKLLLADQGLVLGLTDARYTLPAPAAGAIEPPLDATALRLDAIYYAAARQLFAEQFGISRERRYRTVTPGTHERWNYLEDAAVGRFGGSRLPSPFAIFDYPAHLSALLRANADARIFFGTGYFDTLTTIGSLEHLRAQYGLPPERLREGRYAAGHMMYSDPRAATALSADLRTFIQEGTPPHNGSRQESLHIRAQH